MYTGTFRYRRIANDCRSVMTRLQRNEQFFLAAIVPRYTLAHQPPRVSILYEVCNAKPFKFRQFCTNVTKTESKRRETLIFRVDRKQNICVFVENSKNYPLIQQLYLYICVLEQSL